MLGTNGDSLGIRQLQQRIKELEAKNKTFEDYNKDLNRQIDKLEEDLDAEKSISSNLAKRILKAIEYIRSQYTITDDDVYLALYGSDGTLGKLENILEGKENE